MAIPQVDINSFTIATQVNTINEIANLEGDLSTLDTIAQDTLTNAINELKSDIKKSKRSTLIYALAMS